MWLCTRCGVGGSRKAAAGCGVAFRQRTLFVLRRPCPWLNADGWERGGDGGEKGWRRADTSGWGKGTCPPAPRRPGVRPVAPQVSACLALGWAWLGGGRDSVVLEASSPAKRRLKRQDDFSGSPGILGRGGYSSPLPTPAI